GARQLCRRFYRDCRLDSDFHLRARISTRRETAPAGPFAPATGAALVDGAFAPAGAQDHRPARGDPGNSAATPASAHEQGNFRGYAPGQCGLATIYRAIHRLEKLG